MIVRRAGGVSKFTNNALRRLTRRLDASFVDACLRAFRPEKCSFKVLGIGKSFVLSKPLHDMMTQSLVPAPHRPSVTSLRPLSLLSF